MDLARIHEGIRRMRFMDVLGRTERSALSQLEAAELLGVCERTFRRWRDRHCEEGETELLDLRLQPSPRRARVREIERMLGLYRELYRGFTVKHDADAACSLCSPAYSCAACPTARGNVHAVLPGVGVAIGAGQYQPMQHGEVDRALDIEAEATVGQMAE
jgi:hypothetical protein